MSSNNLLCVFLMIATGALILNKCKQNSSNDKEYFNENSYKLLFPNLQFTETGRDFLNVPGNKNVIREEPTKEYLPHTMPTGTSFYSRPNYNTAPSYRFNADGTTAQTRGRAAQADGPYVATYSSLDAMMMADMASNVSNGKTSKVSYQRGSSNEGSRSSDVYEDPLKYIPTSELLVQPNVSAMTFGKDPSDPQTFMYTRNIFANQKRRSWAGADLIRGDLPIAPDNRGWFQVSAHAHLDLRRGALQFIGDNKQDVYNNIGPDIQSNVSLQDTAVENMRSSGKDKLISPAAFDFQRMV
jgi:hypothetical protein